MTDEHVGWVQPWAWERFVRHRSERGGLHVGRVKREDQQIRVVVRLFPDSETEPEETTDGN